jgi:hypothetical protein
VPRHEPQGRLPTTEVLYQQFAEQFIDAVLDPGRPWLVEYVLTFGFPPIPTQQDIESGRLAIKMHEAVTSGWFVEAWFGELVLERNKEKLVPWAKQQAKERKLTKDEMARLLDSLKSEKLKQSLKGLRDSFRFRRGPAPRVAQDQYKALLKTADLLRPAISKLLVELSSTSHTLQEILKYMQKDYSTACAFLLRHEFRLAEALRDPKLLERAQKRRAARAGVIASAMAGCDYKLAFSTSIERVREARRRLKQSSESDNS